MRILFVNCLKFVFLNRFIEKMMGVYRILICYFVKILLFSVDGFKLVEDIFVGFESLFLYEYKSIIKWDFCNFDNM